MQIHTRRAVSTSSDPRIAAREMFEALHTPDMALAILYCSPSYDRRELGDALAELFGSSAPVIGCTTAGEITPIGYLEGSITGVSLAGSGVVAHTERIDQLRELAPGRGAAAARAALFKMAERGVAASSTNCVAYLLCDGLAMQEEALASALYGNLLGIPLVGGSAGDGVRFGSTHLYHQGRFHTDCALFTLLALPVPFKTFRTEHFTRSAQKLVVTGADPAHRIVRELNGYPAARAYARVAGCTVDELSPAMFAAHPIAECCGGDHYVRSIQRVADRDLHFFCALDEGSVLTVVHGGDIVQNLEDAFANIERELGPPALVLGCDSVLRYLELEQRGCRAQISKLFTQHNVVGFATYGEQHNAMHVNHTFTGVAISGR